MLPKTLFRFIWHFLRAYTTIVIIFILLAIGASFWGPFNSLLIKHIINLLPNLSPSNISPLFLPASLIVINFIVFDNFTWRGSGYIIYKYQGIIKNNIIKETLEQVLNNSHQFFQDNLAGRISSQIMTLADNIELILSKISADLIRGLSLFFVSFLLVFRSIRYFREFYSYSSSVFQHLVSGCLNG